MEGEGHRFPPWSFAGGRDGAPARSGYGDPRLRDPEAVRDDVLDGLITADEARQVYASCSRPTRRSTERRPQPRGGRDP